MDDLRRLYTYGEVAKHYGVAPRTVRHWALKGAIEVVRTPGGSPRVAIDGNGDAKSPDQTADRDGEGHD